MTVTYGFYNSLAGDRKYNAIQLSSLFDGIILDGVFEDYGDAFAVTPNSGMDINVGTGRAWFNHTWTLNDDVLVLTVDDAETVLKRIDTVILEVNTTVEVRTNTIKILKGTPSSTPVAPTLTNAGGLYQYALYDIFVEHAVTEIVLGNITSRLGTDTPYVIGVIETSGLATLQDEIDAILAASYEYKIVPSVASNNLTVALKRIDGSDPTPTNKIIFRVGDTEYNLTAAMSYTKAAGTNWHNMGNTELTGNEVDLFFFAIGETGAAAGLKFGHSRIGYAKKMGDFINTTTSEKYIAGNWTNFNSNDPVTCLGRFTAILSAASAHNWSVPTFTPVNLIHKPIESTRWLNWAPVHAGFSTPPSGGGMRYMLRGNTLMIQYCPLNVGTSNGPSYTIVTPFYSVNISGFYQYSTLGDTLDNTAQQPNGTAWIGPNANILNLTKSGLATWTATGSKMAAFQMFYEI